MFLKKFALVLFLNFLIAITGFSQHQALNYIDIDDLKQYLTFIADDNLQGRRLGTEVDGLGITAGYLADYAEQIGLLPGAEDYFQKVDLVLASPETNSFVELLDENDKSYYKTSTLIKLSDNPGTGLGKKEMVLLGFGYQNQETGYNDFEDVEIKNKVVLVAQGTPESFTSGNSFRWNNRLEREKIEKISEKKPAAIIIITNPKDSKNQTYSQIKRWFSRQRYQLKYDAVKNPEPLVCVSVPELADKMLGGKGKFTEYLTKISKGVKSEPVLLKDGLIRFTMKTEEQSVDAKNVIGIVEGSHPKLKNECVVFMAHYDHLGVNDEGDVYNGADDNGSGTVTLMEVAEAFMSLHEKPKRSIVFLWVTAEEIGLFGSRYYTENPVFPLENTVACINIDMDGRVYEPRDSVWKRSPKMVKDFDGLFTLSNKIWPALNEISNANCEKLGLIPDNSLPGQFLRSSDHYHFHNNNVPILNYATGYHADYHKVGDEVSKINFEKIKRVSDLCFLVGLEIANMEEIEIKKE